MTFKIMPFAMKTCGEIYFNDFLRALCVLERMQ